jgi:hypothetical protein
LIPTAVLLGQTRACVLWFVGTVGAKGAGRCRQEGSAVEVVTYFPAFVTDDMSEPVKVSLSEPKHVNPAGNKTVKGVLESEELRGRANAIDVGEIQMTEGCHLFLHGVAKRSIGAAFDEIQVLLEILGRGVRGLARSVGGRDVFAKRVCQEAARDRSWETIAGVSRLGCLLSRGDKAVCGGWFGGEGQKRICWESVESENLESKDTSDEMEGSGLVWGSGLSLALRSGWWPWILHIWAEVGGPLLVKDPLQSLDRSRSPGGIGFGAGEETCHWLGGTCLVGRSVLVRGSCRYGTGLRICSYLGLRKLALVLS